jgi:hypothetical protein
MRQGEKFESGDQDGITQAYLAEIFAGRFWASSFLAPQRLEKPLL